MAPFTKIAVAISGFRLCYSNGFHQCYSSGFHLFQRNLETTGNSFSVLPVVSIGVIPEVSMNGVPAVSVSVIPVVSMIAIPVVSTYIYIHMYIFSLLLLLLLLLLFPNSGAGWSQLGVLGVSRGPLSHPFALGLQFGAKGSLQGPAGSSWGGGFFVLFGVIFADSIVKY